MKWIKNFLTSWFINISGENLKLLNKSSHFFYKRHLFISFFLQFICGVLIKEISLREKNAVLSMTDIFWQSKVVQMYRLGGGVINSNRFLSWFDPSNICLEKKHIFSKMVKCATFSKEIHKDFAEGKKCCIVDDRYILTNQSCPDVSTWGGGHKFK